MRTLILLYAYKALKKLDGPIPPFAPTPLPLDLNTYYGNSVHGDCYFAIAQRWLELGYVDAVKAIAIQYPEGHARYSPAGVVRIADKFDFYVLPDIRQYRQIHNPDPRDIVFSRGHPPWEPILEQHPKSFKLFYSGGADLRMSLPRYPVDVVLCDDPSIKAKNVHMLELIKTCDENVFKPLDLPKSYDVCFVARIERDDKKGQLEFSRLAKKSWKVIFLGEIADQKVAKKLKELWPSCEIAGNLPKDQVNEVLNRSRVSVVYAKGYESGTRNITESLASGTPVVLHKRNVGRKYLTPRTGVVSGGLLFRWKLASAIENYQTFEPRREYEKNFHSRKVAKDLWERLGVPDQQ